jgi:hypothetical protein
VLILANSESSMDKERKCTQVPKVTGPERNLYHASAPRYQIHVFLFGWHGDGQLRERATGWVEDHNRPGVKKSETCNRHPPP